MDPTTTDNFAASSSAASGGPIRILPHGAEIPLKILLTVTGIFLWIIILFSMIGIFYGVFIGLFLFVAHLSLIVHLRGNSVKLGPNQMPALYQRVATLSERIGMKKVPDAYLVQSNGVLNAFATKFGSRNFIALYSEMVGACGDNMDALDFIIGHELGHLHRGHLRWRIFKAPAMFLPFIGSAYYRSCEYTCDKYGKESCADHSKCIDGLCLLGCGPRYLAKLNRQQFLAQADDLNSPMMKLGTWFGTHPPLVKRIAAINPSLRPDAKSEIMATLGALAILALLVVIPIGASAYFMKDFMARFESEMARKTGFNSSKTIQGPITTSPYYRGREDPELPDDSDR